MRNLHPLNARARTRNLIFMLALTAAVAGCQITPAQMAYWHRSHNPDGPYAASVCQTPEETGSRWWCAPAKVQQLRYEAPRVSARINRQLASRPSCAPGDPAGCASMIRAVFADYGLDGGAAVSVASCESGLNPSASNGGSYLGLFQHSASAWPSRAEAYGVPGASPFNGEANAIVAAHMVRDDGGWGQWQCQP